MKIEELEKELQIEEATLNRLRELLEEERRRQRQQQAQGIAQARARGVQFGRPRIAISDIDRAYALYKKHSLPVSQIAELFGVSRSTMYRKLQEYRIELAAQDGRKQA